MKTALVMAVLLCAGVVSAWAEDPSYEADVGLIRPGGFILFYNAQGPLSYRALTFGDLPAGATFGEEVRAAHCQHAVSIPLHFLFKQGVTVSGAQGNGGFNKAMAGLQHAHPQLDGIFDVKLDVHQFRILGLYTRDCTEIVARGFQIPHSPPSN